MTDFRALCAELLRAIDTLIGQGESPANPGERLILTVHLEDLEDCANRARIAALAAQPEPVAPTDEELDEFAVFWWGSDIDERTVTDVIECCSMTAFARAVLARYGTPTAQPVPVSERLPGPEDLKDLYCWWWHEETGDVLPHWVFAPAEVVENQYLAWLPHWALPVPAFAIAAELEGRQ